MRYTKFGVPILKDEQIEETAYEILSQYDENLLKTPGKTPIAGILDYLRSEHDVRIIFTFIGIRNGSKILGKTIFSKNTILIDEGIARNLEPLFLFTGAHEIGHWYLHRGEPIRSKESSEVIGEVDDIEYDFRGVKRLITPRDWIEHHANYFAGSLLMPRVTFVRAVSTIQKSMGITHNIGKILLDRQRASSEDLNKIISHLKEIFGTSKQSITIRLKSLSILLEDESRRLLHISEVWRK